MVSSRKKIHHLDSPKKQDWHLRTRGTTKALSWGASAPAKAQRILPGPAASGSTPAAAHNSGQLISLSHLSSTFPMAATGYR